MIKLEKTMRTAFTLAAMLAASSAAAQTAALNSQSNSAPVLATSSVLNMTADTELRDNSTEALAYGNAMTYSPTDGIASIDSTQTNASAIEARMASVTYLAPTVTANSLRSIAYGNLAIMGIDGGSILSTQSSTTTSGGVTATTADVYIGAVINDGVDPGVVEVSGNSVTTSATGNSASYTITR
jgi:hypothetical protein